jgi:hypothetical protein
LAGLDRKDPRYPRVALAKQQLDFLLKSHA